MLDIETPKGHLTIQQEIRAAELFHMRHPHIRYITTRRHGEGASATADGIFVQPIDSVYSPIVGVVEVKCRDLTAQKLQRFENRWLVTYEKIEQMQILARTIGVPFYGMLYLVPEDTLLLVLIWGPDGGNANFYVEETKTQRTVNGGEATRPNAFIDMTRARIIRA